MQHVSICVAWLRRELAACARQAPVVAQSMVEYAIIAAIVAVIALTAVNGLGGQISAAFGRIGSNVDQAGSSSSGGSGANP